MGNGGCGVNRKRNRGYFFFLGGGSRRRLTHVQTPTHTTQTQSCGKHTHNRTQSHPHPHPHPHTHTHICQGQGQWDPCCMPPCTLGAAAGASFVSSSTTWNLHSVPVRLWGTRQVNDSSSFHRHCTLARGVNRWHRFNRWVEPSRVGTTSNSSSLQQGRDGAETITVGDEGRLDGNLGTPGTNRGAAPHLGRGAE